MSMVHIEYCSNYSEGWGCAITPNYSCNSCPKGLKKVEKRIKSAFNIGDIVRRKDGDGRWHRIVRVEWEDGLREGYFVYHFADGDCSFDGFSLELVEKRVLHLVLTHHWYDMIDLHSKRAEYRADSDYYRRRLTELKTPMTWYIDGMAYGRGIETWGAPKEDCYIISFSERETA